VITMMLAVTAFGLSATAQEEKAQMLPPVVFQGTGSVTLRDGSTVTGTVFYKAIGNTYVSIVADGGSGAEHGYKAKEVLRFNIGSTLWFVKTIKDAISAGGNLEIVRLENDSTSKLKLYTTHQQDGTITGGLASYLKKTYVELPGADRLYSTNNLYFMPFHKKMAEITAGCPELSKKIADKEDGYKVKKLLGLPTNLETMETKAINEYNNCQTPTAAPAGQ
jgi:hypothetical protein